MSRFRKNRKPWKVHSRAGHQWPIAIGRVGDLATPYWVWGDVGMANDLADWLNRRDLEVPLNRIKSRTTRYKGWDGLERAVMLWTDYEQLTQ